MVTHDIDEAIYLSDRIIVLSSKPGVVKADIEVELPRPRERSSYDFLQIRRNVMKALFEKDGGSAGSGVLYLKIHLYQNFCPCYD